MCGVTGQKRIREAMQSHSLSGSLLRTRPSYLLVVMSRVYITRKHQGKAGETLDLSWLGVGSGEMALSRPRRALGWCPIPGERRGGANPTPPDRLAKLCRDYQRVTHTP